MRWLVIGLVALIFAAACEVSPPRWDQRRVTPPGQVVDMDVGHLLVKGMGSTTQAGSFILHGDRRIDTCWRVYVEEGVFPSASFSVVGQDGTVVVQGRTGIPRNQTEMGSGGCALSFLKAGTFVVQVEAPPDLRWAVGAGKAGGPQTPPARFPVTSATP